MSSLVLIAMKVLSQNDSDRVRDKGDLQQLLNGASADDLIVARHALDLIARRSFNRNKNLRAELEVATKAYAPELMKQ